MDESTEDDDPYFARLKTLAICSIIGFLLWSLAISIVMMVFLASVERSRPKLAMPPPAPSRPAYLPDPRITPGAIIVGVTRDQTCDPNWTRRSRSVPESLRLAVFRAYGINPPSDADRKANELDHRVPVALGGASNLSNIWVQPWDGVWGARVKDRLEAHAWREVCGGRLTLSEAQSWFLGDWTKTYARLWGTPTPRMGGPLSPEADDDYDNEGFPQPE